MRAAGLLLICAVLAPVALAQTQEGAAAGISIYEPQPTYSIATLAGDFAHLSAVPSSPDQEVGDAVTEVLTFLNSTLVALGGSLENTIKVTAYLVDIGDFSAMNVAYADFFPQNPPVRSTVEASSPGAGAPVAFDLVAYFPGGAAAAASA